MKIYQFLENTFKFRISSDEEIPVYLQRMSQLGKFDWPKQLAVLTESLRRMAKIESELSTSDWGGVLLKIKELEDIVKKVKEVDSTVQPRLVGRPKKDAEK